MQNQLKNPKKLKRLYRQAGQQGVRIIDQKGKPISLRELMARQRGRRPVIRGGHSYPGHMKALPNELLPPKVQLLVEQGARLRDQHGQGMVSRNSPCPCGTGLRFKRCCMTGLKR